MSSATRDSATVDKGATAALEWMPSRSAPPGRPAGSRPAASLGTEELLVVCVTGLAAAIRFYRLGHQSYWLDEAFTVMVIKHDFVHMLSTIPRTEKTPPLYYMVAWLWSRVFGYGEFALRSLSALAGAATVPVAYATAKRLFSARVGLIGASLIAVNPFLLYFSQEARSYALLVLLSTCALWAFADAWLTGSRRALTLWSVFSALAVFTHYFAVFLLIPESAVLLWKLRDRRVVLACAGWLAVELMLLPLLLHQRSQGGIGFITAVALKTRVVGIPHDFLVGSRTFPIHGVPLAAGVLAAVGIGLAILFLRRGDRAGARTLLLLAAAAIAIPAVLALGGADYLISRNVLPALVPIALVCAAGFGAVRPALGRLSIVAAALALGAVADGYYVFDQSLQRDDWRSVAAHLGGPGTAVVVSPGYDTMPLSLYAKSLRPARGPHALSEVDVVGQGRPPHFARPPGPSGFALVQGIHSPSYELLRYRAAAPQTVSPGVLQSDALGHSGSSVVVNGGGR
jgi:mannosyltransferase